MGKDPKASQRAALKKKKREKELREAQAHRRTAEAEHNPRRALHKAADLPIVECVVSRGWADRGLAHVLLARRNPGGKLAVGGYFVDVFCLGLKDSAVMPSVDEQEYREKVKPNIFNDPVEFEDCDPGVARAIVEGAIDFAAGYGFRPNKRWEESRHLFQGIEPKPAGIAFGKDGKPCLVRRGGDRLPGAVARLERKAGLGNFLVEDQ